MNKKKEIEKNMRAKLSELEKKYIEYFHNALLKNKPQIALKLRLKLKHYYHIIYKPCIKIWNSKTNCWECESWLSKAIFENNEPLCKDKGLGIYIGRVAKIYNGELIFD